MTPETSVVKLSDVIEEFNAELGSDKTRLFLQAINAGIIAHSIDPYRYAINYGYSHSPIFPYSPTPPQLELWVNGWHLMALQIGYNFAIRYPVGGMAEPTWILFPDPSVPPQPPKVITERVEVFDGFGDRFLSRLVSKALGQSKKRKRGTWTDKYGDERNQLYLRVPHK